MYLLLLDIKYLFLRFPRHLITLYCDLVSKRSSVLRFAAYFYFAISYVKRSGVGQPLFSVHICLTQLCLEGREIRDVTWKKGGK